MSPPCRPPSERSGGGFFCQKCSESAILCLTCRKKVLFRNVECVKKSRYWRKGEIDTQMSKERLNLAPVPSARPVPSSSTAHAGDDSEGSSPVLLSGATVKRLERVFSHDPRTVDFLKAYARNLGEVNAALGDVGLTSAWFNEATTSQVFRDELMEVRKLIDSKFRVSAKKAALAGDNKPLLTKIFEKIGEGDEYAISGVRLRWEQD